METEQRVEHTGGGKPNRIENLRTDPGGELTAGDAYELDMWRVALAENRRKRCRSIFIMIFGGKCGVDSGLIWLFSGFSDLFQGLLE